MIRHEQPVFRNSTHWDLNTALCGLRDLGALIDGAVGALERPIKTVLWWLTRLFRMVSSILCGHGGLLRNDMQQLLPARSGFSTTNYAATVCQHPLQS
jgi:hypothetical protein